MNSQRQTDSDLSRTPSSEEHYDRNRSYYDRNAGRYEAASWYYFNAYKRNAVRAELKTCLQQVRTRNPIRVLEIGPGTGYLLEHLLDQTATPVAYTALEHSSAMAETLKQRFSHRCHRFQVLTRSATAESVQMDDGAYDIIMGSSILHHLPDYAEVISALAKQLTPGGVIYFVREPIHREEVKSASWLTSLLERGYAIVNRILMRPQFQKRFWPEKVKAEDARNIAIHMFGDGVSMRPFEQLQAHGEFAIIQRRKYNRRVSAALSYLENAWLSRLRKDLFGNTLFSVIVRRQNT